MNYQAVKTLKAISNLTAEHVIYLSLNDFHQMTRKVMKALPPHIVILLCHGDGVGAQISKHLTLSGHVYVQAHTMRLGLYL